ncbi:MAG: ATP-binding protein [Armatimonadetes bacterium]|nr:ATP-binding protein [Armatimonadota bacterium]
MNTFMKNGYLDTLPAIANADWRGDCLSESLRGHNNAEYDDALLRTVRRVRPQSHTLFLTGDREQVLAFLRQEVADLRELAPTTERFNNDVSDAVQVFIGWWGGSWRGAAIEIVFSPTWYGSGSTLLLGDDAARVREFAFAMNDFAERPQGRTLLYSGSWTNAPEIDAEIGKIAWDDIVLPDTLIAEVRATVEGWATGKAMYEAMGFSWRRGILLVGPPGTGKTMIGKAVAAQLPELPFLYVRDLRNHGQQDAVSLIFRRARKLAPCILVLEDVDTLITPANRSVLLNEMDGFKSNEGILIIASTNHPHLIDEAFLKRPSRFDRVFHIGLPEGAERAAFCRRVLSRSAFASRLAPGFDTEGLIAKIVDKSKGFTPAYLKEALTGAALALAHTGNADVLDERYTAAVLAQVDELKKTMRRLKDPAALAEMTTGGDGIGYRRGTDD